MPLPACCAPDWSKARGRVRCAIPLAFAFSVACSGGGDGGTPPPAAVASVGVALAASSIAVGATTQATATPRDAQGNTLGGRSTAWSSSNSSAASVSAAGLVTGLAVGSTTVTATVEGQSGQAALTVTPPPVASVTVTLAAASLQVGQSTQATAVTRDAQGNALTGRAVTWSTSNSTVATVGSNGLVSALAAGSVNVVATSEGSSGQVPLTVTQPAVDLQLGTITQNGRAADLSRLAGTVTVSLDQTLPAGWTGTLTFRVGNVVLREEPLQGPLLVAGGDFARSAPVSRNYAVPVTVINATEIGGRLNLESAIKNIPSVLTIVQQGNLPGQAPTSVTRTVNVTPAQPPMIVGYTRQSGNQFITVGGQRVSRGDRQFVVAEVDFGSGPGIEGVTVLRDGASSIYGSDATAGVVNHLLRRTRSELGSAFTISESQWPYEDGSSGAILRASRMTPIGGSEITLFNTDVQLLGNCWRHNGGGFPISSGTAATCPNPIAFDIAPVTFQGNIWDPVTVPFWNDHTVNGSGNGAFSLRQRNTAINTPVYLGPGLVGGEGNFVAPNHDFLADVSYAGFGSDRSGIDQSATKIRYGTIGGSKQPWNPSLTLSLSVSFNHEADAEFCDRLANCRIFPLTTNLLNPRRLDGSSSTSLGFGMDAAALRIIAPTGSVTISGIANPYLTRMAPNTSQAVIALLGGVPEGLGANFAGIRATFNGQPLLGAGTSGADPVWYATSASSTSGNASFVSTALTGRAQTQFGSIKGRYDWNLSFANKAGSLLPGSHATTTYSMLYDPDQPTTGSKSLTGSLVPRGTYRLEVQGFDPYGLLGAAVGWRTTKSDPLFLNDRFAAWTENAALGSFSAPPVTSVSVVFNGTVPGAAHIANSAGLFLDAPVWFDAVLTKFFDLAGNVSAPELIPFPTTSPASLSTVPVLFEQYSSTNTFGGSFPLSGFLDVGIRNTSMSPPTSARGIVVSGVHEATRELRFFGQSSSFQSQSLGGGLYRHIGFVPFNRTQFGGPTGDWWIFGGYRTPQDDWIFGPRKKITIN